MRFKIFSLTGIVALCLTIGASSAEAQYLVSSDSLGYRTKAQLDSLIGIPVRTGISLFKVRYMTTDVHGLQDTASGLLVLPNEPISETLPMVIYQHGTTNGPADAPSLLAAGSLEAIAYGAMGYTCIAPDYLGLGDNDRTIHPYMHAATEASAGRDMLFGAAEWLDNRTGAAWIGEIFVSGYSQGGHAATALLKDLEDSWSLVFPVTAATPMSGPYSVSGVMYERLIGEETYFSPAYIAYVTLGYQEAYGNLYTTLSDIFKAPYVPIIESFRDGQSTLSEMNFSLITTLFLNGGVMPKKMFVDSVLANMIANENDPFRVAFRENDVYNWAPATPTRLYYCTDDEQIPYQNAIVADSVMRMLGAPDVMAVNFGAFDHVGCAPLAIAASIVYFDSFILPLATEDPRVVQQSDLVAPNPVGSTILLTPEFADRAESVNLIDMQGRLVISTQSVPANGIEVSHLQNGTYVIRVVADDMIYQEKIIVLH